MWTGSRMKEPARACGDNARGGEKLDRAMVAGLILEVVLDYTDLPENHQARQRVVKTRMQDYLVQYLAGQVSLDRFRRLAQNLDDWFDFYYPLLVKDRHPGEAQNRPPTYCVREIQAAYTIGAQEETSEASPLGEAEAPMHHACQDKLLDAWLEQVKREIPQRSHRKLTPAKLKDFLGQSGGRWFRLRDFERFIPMDRKTAWDYVQLFLQTGLLCHNRKNSAAVRYCLAPSFLKVEADALRLALSLTLTAYQEDIVENIGDFLIATGGESFPESRWKREFPGDEGGSLLKALMDQDILVWQRFPSGAGLLKLHQRWRYNEGPLPASGESGGRQAWLTPPEF